MKKAFTVLEILTVLALIALLTAILTPVFITARDRARVTQSASNLRQIYIQTLLYQTEYGGVGNYGSVYEMGLPPEPAYERLPLLQHLLPPFPKNTASEVAGRIYFNYYFEPHGSKDLWAVYVVRYQDAAMLYADPFHNPTDLPLDKGRFIEREITGINLAGSLRRQRATGDWQDFSWWHRE